MYLHFSTWHTIKVQVTTLWPQLNFHVYFLSCTPAVSRKKFKKKYQLFLEKCGTLLFEDEFWSKNLLTMLTLKLPGLCFTRLDQGLIIIFGAYICFVGKMHSGVKILVDLHFDFFLNWRDRFETSTKSCFRLIYMTALQP